MSTFNVLVLIFVGGGLGSITRYGTGVITLSFFPASKFPLGTLIANVLACLILGVVLYSLKDKILNIEWIKYLIVIGFCGGFSTFSTFSADTVRLFQDGLYLLAFLNVLLSVGLGFVILWSITK